MEHVIVIRIGELFLKGNNKPFFLSKLLNNIKESLKSLNFKLLTSSNRFYIEEYNLDEEDLIIQKLKKVFGIHSLNIAVKLKTDIDTIAKFCIDNFPKQGVFRVSVVRADKTIPYKSNQIAAKIGESMLNNSNQLSVNLEKYDFNVNIDIRENGYTYIIFKTFVGSGGLPVGTSGNALTLLSGGIDSPVATYLMAKRGIKIFAIHFYSFPFTDQQAKDKVIELRNILTDYCGNIKLFMVPFTKIQIAIKENCPIEYMITLMRRFMMRIAQKICFKYKCKAIITGESLGQVASQTMESITTTNAVVKLPIFRPLIGFDKSEIIDISKKIDTFNTSILPYEDCCTVFLPDKPVIRPMLKDVELMEQNLNIDELINDAINNLEILD